MCIGLTKENRLLHFNTYHIMMPIFDTYTMCVEVLKNLARYMQHAMRAYKTRSYLRIRLYYFELGHTTRPCVSCNCKNLIQKILGILT